MKNLFLPSYIWFLIKGLIFVILSESFLFLHGLTRLLQSIEINYYLFYWKDLLLLFYPIRRMYILSTMNWVFYGTYNSINEHNQR